MASNTNPPSSETQQQQQQQPSQSDQTSTDDVNAPLQLPALPSTSSSDQNPGGTTNTVSLDALGPMVVNTDGTMSRISNWGSMTDGEKERTLRLVGKRNRERREGLEREGGGKE